MAIFFHSNMKNRHQYKFAELPFSNCLLSLVPAEKGYQARLNPFAPEKTELLKDKQEEIFGRLKLAFEELTDSQKEVLSGLFFEKLTQTEIAKKRHTNQSTTAQIKKAGLKKLKKILSKDSEFVALFSELQELLQD